MARKVKERKYLVRFLSYETRETLTTIDIMRMSNYYHDTLRSSKILAILIMLASLLDYSCSDYYLIVVSLHDRLQCDLDRENTLNWEKGKLEEEKKTLQEAFNKVVDEATK